MPRRPKVKILSPRDSRLQKEEAPPELVPMPIVRGLVRGLLKHCWSPTRRPTKEGRIDQTRLEDMILTNVCLAIKRGGANLENVPQLYANRPKKPDDSIDSLEWFVDYFASQIPTIFQLLTGHNYFIVSRERDLLIEHTAENYPPPGKTLALRLQWIKEHLPSALQLLKEFTLCSACSCRTTVPDDATLQEMAHIRSPGELVPAILGYFHRISADSVKRLLSFGPPA